VQRRKVLGGVINSTTEPRAPPYELAGQALSDILERYRAQGQRAHPPQPWAEAVRLVTYDPSAYGGTRCPASGRRQMSSRGQGGARRAIPIRAVGYSSLASDYPLTFPPPLAEHSANPGIFESSWHLIQYVFNLPDPRGFPPFADPPSGALTVLRRYSAAARELAESTFLAHPTGITVNVLDGGKGERIEKNFAPKENIRGFSVLFRQFHANDEPASFNAAQRTLRRLNAQAGDGLVTVRDDYLVAWGRAARKLRGFPLNILVGKQLQAEGRWHRSELP
jgi:hypothetical protein